MRLSTKWTAVSAAVAMAFVLLVSCSDEDPHAPQVTSSGTVHSISPYNCTFDGEAAADAVARQRAAMYSPPHTTVKLFLHRLTGATEWTWTEINQTVDMIEAELAEGNVYVFRVGQASHPDPGMVNGSYDVYTLLNQYGSDQRVDLFFGTRENNTPNGWANGLLEAPYGAVVWGPAMGTNVPTHEIGHVLGLPHTHGGRDTGICPTGIVDGDSPPVNDTPPDPGLGHGTRVAEGCIYDPPDADECPFLLAFHPDTDNIMSYTRLECLLDFTSGQHQVMRAADVVAPSITVHATVSEGAPSPFATCPAGDGGDVVIDVDFALESASPGDIDASRITLVPAPGPVTFLEATPIQADGPATAANGYQTSFTVSQVIGCGNVDLEVQLDGHYIGDISVDVNSFDVNGDGTVNLIELGAFAMMLDLCSGDPGYNDCYDFVDSGCIDIDDQNAFVPHYGHSD